MDTIQLATADSKEEAYEIMLGPANNPEDRGLSQLLLSVKALGRAEMWTLEVIPTVHDGTAGGNWQVVLHVKKKEETAA